MGYVRVFHLSATSTHALQPATSFGGQRETETLGEPLGESPPDCRLARRLGCVLVVLLSDWAPGGGGTALIPGSHAWIDRELRRRRHRGEEPPTHAQLNAWLVQQMRVVSEAGRLRLPSCSCSTPESNSPSAEASQDPARDHAPQCSYAASVDNMLDAFWTHHDPDPALNSAVTGDAGSGDTVPPDLLYATQLTGRAGDIAILHPWTVHSGTTNCSPSLARVMLNGMVLEQEGAVVRPNPGFVM